MRRSASFECAIILWALKEIDPRLPAKVRREFEQRLSQPNITLMDLQVPIFQSIPTMLEEMDRSADGAAMSLRSHPSTPTSLQAFTTGGGPNKFQQARFPNPARGGRGFRGRGGARSPQYGGGYRTGGTGGKMCSVCQLAGKHERVVRSHDASTCNLIATLKSMEIEEEQNMFEDQNEELHYDEEELHQSDE